MKNMIFYFSCRKQDIERVTCSETEKIKKLLTNDKRCDNLLKLSLETTTKQRTLITKQ